MLRINIIKRLEEIKIVDVNERLEEIKCINVKVDLLTELPSTHNST